MQYRNLGNSGLKVSSISMGTVFRGNPDEQTCKATISRAIELGVSLIDCANTYQNGHSERMVGDVVGQHSRDELVVTTKVCEPVGDGPNDQGLSRGHILREIESSLSRLQMDYVDIYLLHHYDPAVPIEETLGALDNLVQRGLVRYIGCCNFAAWQVCKANGLGERNGIVSFNCVQNPYNLISRELENEMMPFCRSEGLGVMVYSPIALGLLSGKYRANTNLPAGSYWHSRQDKLKKRWTPDVEKIVETIGRIGASHGKSSAQTAIAWLLSHREVSTVITGPDTIAELEENLGGSDWELSPAERLELDELSS